MVPNIRPLETLHNSLSLNQITDFFDNIIQASVALTLNLWPDNCPSRSDFLTLDGWPWESAQ